MSAEATLAPVEDVGTPTDVRRWPRYPEYKDSGIAWLGNVPAHWSVRRLKQVARLESGHTPSRAVPEYWENCTIPWVSLADVGKFRSGTVDFIEDTSEKISELGLANSAARLLPSGTVILSRTASVGFSAILSRPMATTQDFVNWICGPALRPRYLLWCFRAMAPEFRRLTMGSTHQTIYMPDVARFVIPLPTLDDQQMIDGFLDRETTKIDALVAKKRRLIELLEEKRAALISHAVTRGLDPSVPMKDSGVQWLGNVPAHWEVRRLKQVARLESGHTPSRAVPEYWENCTIPWVSLADVGKFRSGTVDFIEDTSEKISELGLANSAARLLPSGTVILSRTASVGFSAILSRPMATTQDFVNWICGPALRPRYLLWCFRAMAPEFRRLTMGSTHQTIYMPDVARFVIPLPTLDDQQMIDCFLDRETAKIDALVGKVRRHVELLGEYRTALISAAVTGKIDVRGEVGTA